jgi:hypothetical protein
MRIPKSKPLVVTMPKEHNYRIEEGPYASRVHRVRRMQRQNCHNCGDLLRIDFALEVKGKEKFLNLAKIELPFDLEHGSDLRKVLTRLIGKDGVAALSGEEVDLEPLLMDKPADVEVEHIRTNKSDQYDYPFVNVCDVQTPGTLVAVSPAVNPEPKEPVK